MLWSGPYATDLLNVWTDLHANATKLHANWLELMLMQLIKQTTELTWLPTIDATSHGTTSDAKVLTTELNTTSYKQTTRQHVNPRAQPECFYHRPISIGYLCVWQLIMCKRINACNPTVPSSWGLTFLLLFLTLSYHSTNSPQFSLPPSTTLYHSVSVHSVLSQLIQQQLSTNIAICFSSTPKINSYTSAPLSPQMMTGPEGNTIMCTVYYIQRGNDIFILFFFLIFINDDCRILMIGSKLHSGFEFYFVPAIMAMIVIDKVVL